MALGPHDPASVEADAGFTATEAILLSALERERSIALSADEAAGIILHEIANISMGLLSCQDPTAKSVYLKLCQTVDGLQLLFRQQMSITYKAEDVGRFIEQIATGYSYPIQFATRGIKEPLVFCPSLVAHVLNNLIRNGSKYAGPGGRIFIQAALHGNDLRIFVHNIGTPIEPALVRDIFHRRLEKSNGMGLGLLICRKCAVRMGGTIKARSHAHGTSFVLSVPLYPFHEEMRESPRVSIA